MAGFTAVKFAEIMRDLFNLMGWKWNEDRMLRVHDEFMEGYDIDDLKRAVYRMQNEEFFKYSKFRVHMDIVRAERLENEAQDERRRDERAIKRMIHGQDNVKCLNDGDCGDCGRDYCPIVDRSAMRAIDAIMNGDVTVEQANGQLAKQYRGIGF
jgi:hypothetical protein